MKRLAMSERQVWVKAFAAQYRKATKKDKGAILDRFIQVRTADITCIPVQCSFVFLAVASTNRTQPPIDPILRDHLTFKGGAEHT